MLSQLTPDKREVVIAFASKTLSKSQRAYSVSKRELLSVVEFSHQFRHYLLGAEFSLRTDHKALVWLHSFRDPTGMLAHWLERLAVFQYTVIHRPGTSHANADGLSRLPECKTDVPLSHSCIACCCNL